MPKMIERLQFEVDRFELYTGLRPTRLLVAPDVLKAYCDELGLLMAPSWGLPCAEFNGYPVEPDPKLPVGAVLVDSERGPMYPLPPPKRAALAASPVGDSEGSPRPWRITDSDPCIIHDAEGGLVAALWSRVRGEGRGRADAALIVAAVNGSPARTLTVQPNDVVVVTSGRGVEMKALHLALKAQFPEWRGFVILTTPGGDALTCVDKRALYERLRAELEPGPSFGPTGPPPSFSREEQTSPQLIHAADSADPPKLGLPWCALPMGHSGPCVVEVEGGPCQRDPVCDQRAGHEGPCRYEFPAGPPVAPARDVGEELAGYAQAEGKARALSSDCRLPLRHAPGCQCGAL